MFLHVIYHNRPTRDSHRMWWGTSLLRLLYLWYNMWLIACLVCPIKRAVQLVLDMKTVRIGRMRGTVTCS